jgi:ribonuclease HI
LERRCKRKAKWQTGQPDAARQEFFKARKQFQRALRKAKRNQGVAILENLDQRRFWDQIRKLDDAPKQHRLPALHAPDGTIVTESAAQLQVLQDKFFPAAHHAEDATQYQLPSDYKSTRPSPTIEDAEIFRYVSGISASCATGVDGIPISIFTKCWNTIGPITCQIVRAAIELGHQPRQLCIGRTIALRKPGRLKANQPKDYRPITMLSTLSKIIEKLMAGRIISYLEPTVWQDFNLLDGFLPDEQFGFRPGRSCEQASARLINAIRKARQCNKTMSVVFLDIAGAYDTVLPVQLLRELEQLQLPSNIIKWTQSFLTDRSTMFTVNNDVTHQISTTLGLPQGSPLSPVLYAIYNRQAIQALKESGCQVIVYADDIAVLAEGTIEENVIKLQRSINRLKSAWCNVFNQQLAPEKSVVVHFGGEYNGAAISEKHFGPDLTMSDGSVIHAAFSARHLGIILDARLTFDDFIQQRLTKVRQQIGALKKLGYNHWGMARSFRINAVTGVILPTIAFSAAAWAPILGDAHMKHMNQEWISVLKWAGGLTPNTPASSVYAETGFYDIQTTLKWNVSSTFARWRILPHMQDIFKEFNRMILLDSNWLNSSNASLSDMAFQNRFIKYPWAPFSIQAPKDWWCPLKSWERNPIKHCVFIVPATKDEAYDAWQAQQDIIANQEGLGIIYTDGSKSEDGVGAASINMSSGERLQWNLPGYASVFQAEALGLEKAISLTPLAYRKLHIFTDSRSVLDGLRFYNNPEPPIRRLRTAIEDRLNETQGSITFQWVPGHRDIPGNDLADDLAKEAAKSKDLPEEPIYPSLQTTRSYIWSPLLNTWNQSWKETRSKNYIPGRLPSARELKLMHNGLSLSESSALSQFRCGHAPLNKTLSRFRTKFDPHCLCGAIETQHHAIVQCPQYDDLRFELKCDLIKLGLSSRLSVADVVDQPEAFKECAKFLVAILRRRSKNVY